MMLFPRSVFPGFIKLTAAVALSAVALCAAVPRGWYLSGSNSTDYESGVDQTQHAGHRVVYLKASAPTTKGFGTLMQDFRADDYAGKRLRFSAMLKAENVAQWAGLWMRIDKSSGASSSPQMLAFDNMQDRPVKGTEDWKNYQVVLDVPKDATGVAFGVLLTGPGNVLLSDVKLETLDSTSRLRAEASPHRHSVLPRLRTSTSNSRPPRIAPLLVSSRLCPSSSACCAASTSARTTASKWTTSKNSAHR